MGGGGGGVQPQKTEKTDNKTKFSKFLVVFVVFLKTLFRENVANLTNDFLCFMIINIKHIFHCAPKNIT